MRTCVQAYGCTLVRIILIGNAKFKEVDIIHETQTRTELVQEQRAIERELRQTKHRYQRIEQQIKCLQDGERKKRSHRLITRGAAVESVVPAVKGMSEREFYKLVECIFDLPEVKTLLPKDGE